jgi:metal-responsive CopG/Arc/MetJ family transcriptional regulator
MKTAVSVPDHIFRSAERLAKRLRKSRSRLYTEAIAEYVARRSPADVTAAYNRVVEKVGSHLEKPLAAATRRTLSRSEW